MGQSSSSQLSTDQPVTQQASGYGSGGSAGSGIGLPIIGIMAVAVVLGGAWMVLAPSLAQNASSSTIAQNVSSGANGIFMRPAQAAEIMGSAQPLLRYTATDLSNKSFVVNTSTMESLVPQLQGNMTDGWVTLSNSSDPNTDASLYYIIMAADNAPRLAPLVGAATISPWFMYAMRRVNADSSLVDGLNYTYGEYTNSTSWAQAVYGWKGRNLVIALVYENPGYLVNESQFVDGIANATP